MNLNNLMEFINKDFPDYEIINIEEIGIPIFRKNISCLANFNKRLSDVMEFTLKLMALNYDQDTIAGMLALDKELIKHAIYDLDAMEMIDIKTNKVTEEGRKYLVKNSYASLNKIELPIIMNSYTGQVSSDKKFISNKTAKNINLNTVKPLLDVNNNDLIAQHRIKAILKDYVGKSDSNIEVDLVGIVSYFKKSTQYMKVQLAVLKSPTNEIRFIVYNSNNKLNELEQKLIGADDAGIRIFKRLPRSFLESEKKSSIQTELISSNKTSYIDILNTEYFSNDNLLLDYVIPLIDHYNVTPDWIMMLESYLRRELKVVIKFVGESYPSHFSKNNILELLKLKAKYPKFLEIRHHVDFEYASLIIDFKEAYIDQIEEFELELKTNQSTIKHQTLYCKDEKVLREYNSELELNYYKNKTEISLEIEKLIKLSKDLNVMMEECYGIYWLPNGQVLNQAKLFDITLANTGSKFSEFTKSLNASYIEGLNDVGKEMGIKNYMFTDFKNSFEKLFKALNRLRIYRNSMQHNDLDAKNLKTYIEFIKEDLNGQFPEFIPNGYLYLQKHILQEIIKAVESTIEDLKIMYV